MKLLSGLILLLLFTKAYSQELLVPLTLEERVSESDLIIEGTVSNGRPFKEKGSRIIRTSNTILVKAILKGSSAKTIELVTEGGVLENEMVLVSEQLSLKEGDHGIFFCKNIRGKLRPYGSMQGLIYFEGQSARDVFNQYGEIENIYREIERFSGTKAIHLENPKSNLKNSAIPLISSISPTTIPAGTRSRLTITGSGFGILRGTSTVGFKNADNGGTSFIEPELIQYIEWSDTKIVVEVPSEAGSGKVKVVVNGLSSLSQETLTIPYARIQIVYETLVYSPVLVNQMAGGYPWRMTRKFHDDSLARGSFVRAFNTWRCSTGVNWFLGSLTDIDSTERDGINTIRFDVADELPAGVLGTCYSYYSACTVGQWFVSEFDIVFNDATNWEYGPLSPPTSKYDFETVALHELGHGHQLGHVIDQTDLMHFSIRNGEARREPSAEDIEGAKLVLSQSKDPICNYQGMKPIPIDACEDSYFAFFAAEAPRVYPIPGEGPLNITYFLTKDQVVSFQLFDVTGKLVVDLGSFKQLKGEHTIMVDLDRFSTTRGIYILKSRVNETDYTSKLISF